MATEIIKADSEDGLFRELLDYKELLFFFTWRDFKLRYKQTFIGMLWVVLQPLLFAGIISLVLTRRGELKFGFENASDVLVIFLGFSLWQFFENCYAGAIKGIDSNRGLAKRIYLPSIIFVLGPVFSRYVDLTLKIFVFTVLAIITGSEVHIVGYIALIFVALILSFIAIGLGLLFGPLNVRFRDISLTVPFISRILFFTTPIWYPFSLIPEQYQHIFLFNPIVSCMELARNGMFDPSLVHAKLVLYPLVEVVLLVLIGIPVFKRTKRLVADYF